VSILIATDLSDASVPALTQAARLARESDEQLIVLHCIAADYKQGSWTQLLEDDDNLSDRLWQSGTNHLQDFLDEHLPRKERPDAYRLRVDLAPVLEGIEQTIQEADSPVSLTILGATGHNRLQQFLIGSTAESAVRRLDTPVLVVPQATPRDRSAQILAPVDMTPCSRQSLEMAARLADRYNSRLSVLHSYTPPVSDSTFVPSEISYKDYEGYEQQKRRELEAFVDEADLQGLKPHLVVRAGSPHQTILSFANEQKIDLITMGTHGRNRVQRFFVGSTTVKVLRQIPCPIMTLRN
jgi:nucleotide-binding universal stress UspA family protein